MMEQITEASPRFKARIAGVFYLLTILARVIADAFVRNRLVVSDDAAATATNVMAHEPLFRLGFAADIIAFASYIALTALLYELLKPVNRSLSLVTAFFSLVACVVQGISSLLHLAPLVLFGGRAVVERIYGGTVAGAGARVSQTARRSLPQHRPGIFRIVLPPGRHPHSQIHFPAAHPWRADGTCRFELRAVSVTTARTVSAALHSGFPRRWANIAEPCGSS